jgi:hypothetical protein
MSRKVWTVLAGIILGGTANAAVISTGIGDGSCYGTGENSAQVRDWGVPSTSPGSAS